MMVEVTVVLRYEIPDDPRTLEAYDVSDMSSVLVKERALLDEDSDYLITTLVGPGTEVDVLAVRLVAEVDVS